MFSHLGTVFAYIGKHSTNIWLTHSFYCYYFGPFAKLVYKSKNFIIDYLVLLALSLVTSILLNLFFWNMSKSVISIFILYYFHGLQINAVPFYMRYTSSLRVLTFP